MNIAFEKSRDQQSLIFGGRLCQCYLACLHRGGFERSQVLLALSILLLIATGCDLRATESPKPNNNIGPLVISTGDPNRCEQQCLTRGLFFARAMLGLDPTHKVKNQLDSAIDVFKTLNEETESKSGVIEQTSVEAALDILSQVPPQQSILIDQANHIHLILGKIEVDGQTFFQLVHGDSSVGLLSRGEVLNVGFREAWKLSGGGDGVVIDIGTNSVHLDKIFENLGEVPHDAKVDCTWRITNRGNSPIVVGKPSLSCGCTTTDLVDETELQPDFPHLLNVTVRSTNTVSLRHTVLLSVADKQTKQTRQIPLYLFGSQRELKKVLPSALSLGTILPGREYSQSITLREVSTDRFSIQKIVCDKFPLHWKIKESKDSLGYRIYVVTFSLETDEATTGRQEGHITITTDSRFAPNVVVPVSFEVVPPVTLRPSVIALGNVPIGKRITRSVEIETRDSTSVSVTVDETTEGIQVDIPARGDKQEIQVHCIVPKLGVWQGLIKGRFAVANEIVSIEIPCIGVGVSQ